MNCKDFREKMFLYSEVDEDFYLHLRECDDCRREFEEFLKVEERLEKKIFEEEINREWVRVYRSVYNRLGYENIKRKAFIFLLLFLEIVLFSLISFLGGRVLKIFLQDFSLLTLTLNSLIYVLSQFNFYLFLLALLLFIYKSRFHGIYK